ncbi:ribosomal protein S18 acetylase RimI-like enzyme [Streptomyces sp. 1114.5]|uniref:GNAT family N-acetyltransferase n=1 Tax=unclassified Streptomyces TaxID=2593676 RepID=UPI000BD2A2BE|nr:MULTISPECIES: GNAT family N-acetyltransferase [unclassified Streptomyces]RKT18978.1 ribosomal protein S18 acetylase RimI-like enzyme [Streptomyces sp. 1114.5]SOB85177.1 Ribosomal protein S18 acetylase RimI [Streptomyces sp. 1331.2]
MPYVVRRIAAEEWRELREITLEALQDSPGAFHLSYADAAARPDGHWQRQAAAEATAENGSATLTVRDEAGSWVGIAGVEPVPDVPDTVCVRSVYVAPAHRGAAGPAVDLVHATIRHARDHTDARWLTLGVNESNGRALAFYRRLGFEDTGKVIPYVRNPAERVFILGYPDFRS